jgi:hypothetical protein
MTDGLPNFLSKVSGMTSTGTKWDHVISQVDNWIWLAAAIMIYVIAKMWEIPGLNAVAGACLVKIKAE